MTKQAQPFDLAAMQARRNAAVAKYDQWELTAEDFKAAYAAAEWNFRSAYLEGAYLYGANLYGANLECANILDATGIYDVFGLGLSSRQDKLYGGVTLQNGEIVLFLNAGCQTHSPTEMRKIVTETHGNNSHAQQYEVAITCIEALFVIDKANGKWEYLKTWHEDHQKAMQS